MKGLEVKAIWKPQILSNFGKCAILVNMEAFILG